MDRDALAAELYRDEGVRLKPYRDSLGFLTIGVGHNLDARGISYEVAGAILREDIARVVLLLDKYCPWWTKLDELRQRALANMAFNLGVGPSEEDPHGKLLTFRLMLGDLEHGLYASAAERALDSAWAREVGRRAQRIAAMIRSGTVA